MPQCKFCLDLNLFRSWHNRYDFSGDNQISADDVYILLSYIPFKKHQGADNNLQEERNKLRIFAESMKRGRSTGHAAMNQEQRELEQREIKSFVQKAFEDVPSFSLEKYLEFNSQISSEMFISVMSILQERLPCSSFYFRERR